MTNKSAVEIFLLESASEISWLLKSNDFPVSKGSQTHLHNNFFEYILQLHAAFADITSVTNSAFNLFLLIDKA